MNSNKKLSRVAAAFFCAMAGLAVFLSIPACHTTQGAGKDIENLGENIQDAADRHD